MPQLEVSDLQTHFRTPRGLLRAVDGVTFAVEAGETLGVVGESGCGKSTLGKSLLRLTDITSGQMVFDGTEYSRATGRELAPLRRRMQMVFQDPAASLNPRHSVEDILETPLKVHGLGDAAARKAKLRGIMDRVGLPVAALQRYPHEFSGGQRQRIGIARALILDPELIVCDEPVSALDLSIQAQILNLLSEMKRDLGLSYIFISHDLSVMRYIADRVLVMYLGRIVEMGDRRSLWRAPRHPYTHALMDAVPDPSRRRHVSPIEGDLPSPLSLPSGCRFHPRCPRATELCAREEPRLMTDVEGHAVACHHPVEVPSPAPVPTDVLPA